MATNVLDSPITPLIEVPRSRTWYMSPSFLNMEDVDTKGTTGVKATSPYLDFRGPGLFNFKLFVVVTADTIAVGAFKLTLKQWAFDGSAFTQLGAAEDILTAIDSTTNGQTEELLFGATINSGGVLFSSGGGTAATKSSNLNKFQMLHIATLEFNITTQATGTSGSASVHMQAGD